MKLSFLPLCANAVGAVVDFYPHLAAAFATVRCLIQAARHTHRWDTRQDEMYRNGSLGGVRQWIESVNQALKGQLDLERHGGRTPAEVFTRIAQRLPAMAAGIWHSGTPA